MFNCINLYNLMLASQMHSFHLTWCTTENAQVCYSACLARYTGNPVIGKEKVLY